MRSFFSLLLLGFFIASGTTGCTAVGTAIGAGATAGVAAFQERGFEGAVDDTQIAADINHLWFQYNLDMFQALTLHVHEGRVLITGAVPKEEWRLEAVRLAWQPQGVQEVINEIGIGSNPDLAQTARDAWISSQLRAQLLVAQDVQNINYTVHTIGGVVYMIGVAQSQVELDQVRALAHGIEGVQRVVSYVRIKGYAPEPVPQS